MKDRSQQIDRYLDGSLDGGEIKELFAWLAESPRNAEVFARRSLLDQHLTELLDSGLVKPLEIPLEKSSKLETVQINTRFRRRFQWLLWTSGLAAVLLIIISLGLALIRSQEEVADLRQELESARHETPANEHEKPATINFYVKEHEDIVARQASLSSAQPEPMQMQVSPDDILYYELPDDGPESMHPGIIVRGPSSPRQLSSSKVPVISNGHILTLSEARQTAGFNLVSPSWLRPGYTLDEIRLIEGRNALHLLYTNGINSVSLFEQPRNGLRGLEPKDFREYAVYRNVDQAAGTILAWRDDELSYVLVGNVEMSQLMDIAQSVSTSK